MSFSGQLAASGIAPPGWTLTASGPWLSAMRAGVRLPDQGWKLHLSATIASAPDLLARALPLLRQNGTGFKIARTLADLSNLNEGRSGLSQVGKFMTVYPPDDGSAVRLALDLDRLTRGIPGPPVPSDRRLCDGSAVYYRYGGFSGLSLRLPHGETVPAIRDPEGRREPDQRREVYSQPDWVTDPFAEAVASRGLTRTPPPLVIAGRVVLTAAISHSPRGRIFLALDLEGQARAIVKEAHEGSGATADGRDATDMLRAEALALESIGPRPYLPRFLGLAREGQSLFLAMEDTGGRTLGSVVAELRARGTPMAWAEVEATAREIAGMIVDLHRAGWLHRDLKPTNVMRRPYGRLAIIDLELAQPIAAAGAGDGRGTPGYMSPAQKAGEPPAVADDLYGFGALVYFLATAGDPGQTPRAEPLRDRPLRQLRPDAPAWFADVIETCLGSPAHPPFRSMEEVARALASPPSPASAGAAPPAAASVDLSALLAGTVS
ncbi:MAG: phosphotransferase, partial [Aestuariivirga sp.]|nr:phosphotransferase [Aestuariivirga sp.]